MTTTTVECPKCRETILLDLSLMNSDLLLICDSQAQEIQQLQAEIGPSEAVQTAAWDYVYAGEQSRSPGAAYMVLRRALETAAHVSADAAGRKRGRL